MKFINFDDIVIKSENKYINENVFTPSTRVILLL